MRGDSRKLLEGILQTLDEPAILWLDGHWSGEGTSGENDECPLIEEIQAINRSSRRNHCILIDDARLFMSSPPRPLNVDQWPDLGTVLDVARSGPSRRYVMVLGDVIVAVPEDVRDLVVKFSQDVNTLQWEQYGREMRESSFMKGSRLMYYGARQIIRSCVNFARGPEV